MPKKKRVNLEQLFEAIEKGTSSKEVMKKFEIKTSAQLKSLYLDALIFKGQAKSIIGRAGRGVAEESKSIVITKRGSLVIPKEMVEEFGFQVEDAFAVRKTKAGISLKKI
ncbi:MAG: hypothetical protein V1816_26205 [Pseudomonadota bacterium]